MTDYTPRPQPYCPQAGDDAPPDDRPYPLESMARVLADAYGGSWEAYKPIVARLCVALADSRGTGLMAARAGQAFAALADEKRGRMRVMDAAQHMAKAMLLAAAEGDL